VVVVPAAVVVVPAVVVGVVVVVASAGPEIAHRPTVTRTISLNSPILIMYFSLSQVAKRFDFSFSRKAN